MYALLCDTRAEFFRELFARKPKKKGKKCMLFLATVKKLSCLQCFVICIFLPFLLNSDSTPFFGLVRPVANCLSGD